MYHSKKESAEMHELKISSQFSTWTCCLSSQLRKAPDDVQCSQRLEMPQHCCAVRERYLTTREQTNNGNKRRLSEKNEARVLGDFILHSTN
jgi:hypothetical protein